MTGSCTTNWVALWCHWLKGEPVKCTRPEIARRTWQLGSCRRRRGLLPNTPDGNTADSERIAGPLPEQIARALTYLRMSPLTSTVSRKDGGGRHDYPSYFDWVLQEAHREHRRPPGLRGIEDLQIIIRLFPDHTEFQNPGTLYNTLDRRELVRVLPAPVRCNQILAGFIRDYKSTGTGGSFMKARSEVSLNLMWDSLRLSGRQPDLEQIINANKLTTINAYDAIRTKKYPVKTRNCSQWELACDEKL